MALISALDRLMVVIKDESNDFAIRQEYERMVPRMKIIV
ncbi:Uncharacterised protein [uncultured archaeon]|nr:Uncharacterised protein [uncultured archaeon]